MHITNIDGAPDILSAAVKLQAENKTENEFYDYILNYSLIMIYQSVDKGMLELIIAEETWERKLEKFLELASAQETFSINYLRLIMNALVNRARSMMYETETLGYLDKTKCTLIKPTEELVLNSSENYDLNKYFEQDVEVINLEGNHQSVLDNPKLISVLNDVHSKI